MKWTPELHEATGRAADRLSRLPSHRKRNEAYHEDEGGFRSLCAICGQPVSAAKSALLWCLSCLGPYIDSYRGFKPVITVRRHYETATERR